MGKKLVIIALFAAGIASLSASAQTTLTSIRVASGLSSPVFVTAPPGDLARVFIVEQSGRIKILTGGSVVPTPYLNIAALISAGGERGLLGLAFHPSYNSNGFFFVNYTNLAGHTVIARYTVQGDPLTSNVADAGSAVILKTIIQPESNHNGGCVQFGPDGMLYVGMGDGGGANDQHGTIGNGQALNTLLGKMLRLDVANPPTYVPADNPFVGAGDPLDEIWALGLRNPWRFSFDRTQGDMYIADVGQNAVEEINFQAAAINGGENYGWRCMEGNNCTGLTGCVCNAPALTLPIHTYTHAQGCSITGGYVYRGGAIPGLPGTYFFGDFCSARIWSFRFNGAVTEFTERTAELVPDVGTINSITSFGEDGFGELYVCDQGGEVFKIVADMIDCNANGTPDDEDIAGGTSQDCNANATPDECELAGNDCNANTTPDECDVAGGGGSADCNANGTPDECETDCNANTIPDQCDINAGTSADCQPNGVPDECELASGDCNANAIPDQCDINAGTSADCQANGTPDECEPDCDADGTPDGCEPPATVFVDNFETDQGWTVVNVTPVTGIWERAAPIETTLNGQIVQPGEDNPAGTGTLCFITDGRGGTAGAFDVDGGPTRLISPQIDASAGTATLSYAYWMFSDFGAFVPDSLVVEVSNNDGASWTHLVTHAVSASLWRTHAAPLDGVIAPTDQMRFRFSIQDTNGTSFTEGGVDDVEVTAADCPTGCEPPPAAIAGACSSRIHGKDPCCIPISGTIPAESSEPRAGGIHELQVTFDAPLCDEAFALNAAAVSIEETSTAQYPLFSPYAGPAVVSTSGSGLDLTLSFAPALAEGRAYRLSFTPAVTALAGQRVDIRALTGDVNSSGSTDAGDRSVVVGVWTGSGFTCPTDVNRSGVTDAGDRSVIVGVWTSGANTAP